MSGGLVCVKVLPFNVLHRPNVHVPFFSVIPRKVGELCKIEYCVMCVTSF